MMKNNRINLLPFLLFPLLLAGCSDRNDSGISISFNEEWMYLRQEPENAQKTVPEDIPNSKWEEVNLPHMAVIESATNAGDIRSGICWYKKSFRPDRKYRGHHIALLFEGAMNNSIVYLNGAEISNNPGGCLPFFVDLTNDLDFGHENEILIRVDNCEDQTVAPDKQSNKPDSMYYGGLCRNVRLIIKDKLHITDAVEVDSTCGGGVMAGFKNVSLESAVVNISTAVQNSDKTLRTFFLHTSLLDAAGTLVSEARSNSYELMPGTSVRIPLEMEVTKPALWSPDHPFLYTLRTEIVDVETVIDRFETRVGIRDLKLAHGDGLLINGEKIMLRGTNRLQEYPYIGNALSDNANFRDAYKIKEAGFNFVRCSDNPQSAAFLDACDELGLMVMESVPGQPSLNDESFYGALLNSAKMMCRRDRNHPSVIIWEISLMRETLLNETKMQFGMLTGMNKTIHSEMPLIQCYTGSRMDTICDVFLTAHHDAKTSDYRSNSKKSRPVLIAEYRGRMYYTDRDHQKENTLSGYGQPVRENESAQLQQAYHFQKEHNSNLEEPSIGDVNWLMFDNNSGYENTESSGIMDLFRLPGFSYWFYRSQSESSPMCFIAYYNLPASGKTARVFSNADSVVLYYNDVMIAKQGPDINNYSNNLNHPPFTFILDNYSPGTIKAVGLKNGVGFTSYSVTTPGKPSALRLSPDLSNRPLSADGSDAIFVYASIVDSTDNLVFNAIDTIEFSIKGEGIIIGDNPVRAKAGIAPILIKTTTNPGKITVKAKGKGLSKAELMIESKRQK